MKYETIQEILNISSKRISAIKKGVKMNHRVGRPPCLTESMLDYIEMLSYANPRLTDGDIASAVKERFATSISKSTIARARRKLGFIYRPPLIKQEVTEVQKQM